MCVCVCVCAHARATATYGLVLLQQLGNAGTIVRVSLGEVVHLRDGKMVIQPKKLISQYSTNYHILSSYYRQSYPSYQSCTHSPLLDELLCVLQVSSNILHEASLLLLAQHLTVEDTRLERDVQRERETALVGGSVHIHGHGPCGPEG